MLRCLLLNALRGVPAWRVLRDAAWLLCPVPRLRERGTAQLEAKRDALVALIWNKVATSLTPQEAGLKHVALIDLKEGVFRLDARLLRGCGTVL